MQLGVEFFLASLPDLAIHDNTTSACLKDALLGLIDTLSIETRLMCFLCYFSIDCALQDLRFVFFIKQNFTENLLHETQVGAKWNSAYILVFLIEKLICDHRKGRS